MSGYAYARLVPKIHRSKNLPKIDRPWRPRMIAWAGPSAFYPNRFYEQDKWYKARIDKPEMIPKLHIIDPTEHSRSLASLLAKDKGSIVNIGFKRSTQVPIIEKTAEERSVLEKKARKMDLLIDDSVVDRENTSPIYKHYNIFGDLFNADVFFDNVQRLEVDYGNNSVYNGNVISACNTTDIPKVSIESVKPGEFNTLAMVNLDGNPYEKEGELVHWMVANIPDGADISQGSEIASYIPPLPFCGTGYHRIAFILLRHRSILSLDKFSTFESRITPFAKFYKENEDLLTPSALSFFQTSYDDSVKQKLHSLGLPSPIYEYEYNEALRPEQKEFPIKPQPFDLYLDMFRDPKDVEADLLEERLNRAQIDNYKAPDWIDPNYNDNKRKLPSWQHKRMLKREGKYQALFENKLR